MAKRNKKKSEKREELGDNNSIIALLVAIGIIVLVILFFVFLNQNFVHKSITGNTVFLGKEIYSPGEKLTGKILFNLMKGESIPSDTVVSISLGDKKEEFVLSDFVDYEPVDGTIYAEKSGLSGEGEVFGIPGESFKEVSFKLEVYTEEDVADSSTETSSEEVPAEETPVEETPTEETPADETTTEEPAQSPPEETPSEPPAEEPPAEPSPITGEVVKEVSEKTVSGTVSKDHPFTYELKEGEKVRVVEGSVESDGEEISESAISLSSEDGVVTVTTDYSVKGFGPEFLGDESAMTFKIDVADLGLEAAPGNLVVSISYGGKEIAYYEDTILVSGEGEVNGEAPEQIKEIPSIRIPPGENAVLDMNEYFSGAVSYEADIENFDANVQDNLVELIPMEGFTGARKAKIVAVAGGQKVESNEFLILVSSGAVKIKTVRSQVRVGEPVVWRKEVAKEVADESIKVEVPKAADNIAVKTVVGEEEQTVETIDNPSILTGDVVIEVKLDEGRYKKQPLLLKNLKSWFVNLRYEFTKNLKITGKAIEPSADAQGLDVVLDEPSATDYVIEYETPGPEAFEEITDNGKIVTVSAPTELGYTDVIAYTTLDNSVPVDQAGKIKVYWHNYESDKLSDEQLNEVKTKVASEVPEEAVVEDISTDSSSPELAGSVLSSSKVSSSDYVKEEVAFDSYDLDGDGKIDYIEWVVPHLSDQTYEIIIEITNAEHLDVNREFLSDIYSNVSLLDGVWSETIGDGEYVRVKFKKNLTSSNDVTVYPRVVSGNPSIEVYELNGSEVIARFDSLADNEYNKVYLTNLVGSAEWFDLKIVGGAVEFDHIVDPDSDGAPRIEFGANTPSSGTQTNSDIFVNLTINDSSDYYAFSDFDSSLVGWWRMDDVNSSGDIVDLSLNSNNGSKVADANQTASGKFGAGYAFDGVGDYVTLGAPSEPHYSGGEMTVAVWIYPHTISLSNVILKRGSSTSSSTTFNNYFLSTYTSNNVLFAIGNGTTNNFEIGGANDLTVDTWNFVVCGVNATSLFCYVNGQPSGAPVATRTIFSGYYSAINTTLIGSGKTNGDYFNGTIDEVLIFNRSLSSQEILALYNASANKYYRNFTGLSERSYTFKGYAVDAAGNKNETSSRTVLINSSYTPTDSVYPVFSNYLDNNASLTGSGTAWFNVTVANTNGSVYLRINNTNYTATNLTANVYNVSVSLTSNGTYPYYWFAYGNGSSNNYNNSETRYYVLNASGFSESVPPILTVVSPVNRTLYNSEWPDFNVSLNENGTWCAYSVNGQNNLTLTMQNATYFYDDNIFYPSLTTYERNVTITCNDSYNNYGYSKIVYYFDGVAPLINFTSPTPANGTSQNSSIYVNLSATDLRTTYSFVDFDSSLVGWWRMDDANASGDIVDLSLSSNNGTRVGGAGQNVSGRFGKGFSFDGSGGYVNLPAISSLDLIGSEFSIAFWVYPRDWTVDNAIIKHGASTSTALLSQSYWLAPISSNRLTFAVSDSATVSSVNTSTSSITTNAWNFVVCGRNSTSDLFCYVNGALNAGARDTTGPIYSGTNTLLFGAGRTNGNYFNGSIDEVLIFNRTLSSQEVLALYNSTANPYFRNFTGLGNRTYSFRGHAVDAAGNRNYTLLRTINVTSPTVAPSSAPVIDYIDPTPNDGEILNGNNFTVAVSVTFNGTTEDAIRFRLYNGSLDLVNETFFRDSRRNITYVGLAAGNYTFNVYVNDTAGNSDLTSDRTVFVLPSCLELAGCSEGSSCVVDRDCHLDSEMCTGGECDFTVLTTNSMIYTLWDNAGNGKDLKLTLTSNVQRAPLLFTAGGGINFAGHNGTTGGNGGTLNITVPDLFNSTQARFYGFGGYSTVATAGGNGGTLQINYHGMIRNLSASASPRTYAPSLIPGSSASGISGSIYGRLIYVKDLDTCPRDVDVNNDGKVDFLDVYLVNFVYNSEFGDSGFIEDYDISCDDLLNVVEFANEGFEIDTR